MSSRRSFLKTAALAAASSLSLAASSLRGRTHEDRVREGRIPRRRLGRTNLMISEISLGGSPLPDWPLFCEIIEQGVNYIDTSVSYGNGNSERQIGRLFREMGRDKAYVATKFHLRGPSWTAESLVRSAETSLARLGVETIDVLMIHGAENPDPLTDERVISAFDAIKRAGKCRFTGLSCHANHAAVIQKAVSCGHYDVLQVGYNVFDIERAESKVETYPDYLGTSGLGGLLALARSKDVGIIAMKTLKVGGRRQTLDTYRTGTASLQQAMLKWVLENKNITSAVTEMLNRTEMEEDLAAAGSPLTTAERRMLCGHVVENAGLVCHSCGACAAECPSSIPTTGLLRALSYQESYGKTDRARALFSRIGGKAVLDACLECGRCQEVCPYGIRVPERLAQAARILG